MEEYGTAVRSVGKALALLDILAAQRGPMTLLELSERAKYPKSTVHGLLSTLRQGGVIRQQPDGRYYLGMKLFEYGCAVAEQWDVGAAAPPYLEHLASETEGSAFISVPEENYVITIDRRTGSGSLRVVADIGCRMPLHATSQGKLLLAQMRRSEALSRVRAAGMTAYTPHTITEEKALCEALDEIVARGYALEDGEYKIGLRSVSAPVYDRSGQVQCAIGVVGLFRRVHSEEFTSVIEAVRETASQLSCAMGYEG